MTTKDTLRMARDAFEASIETQEGPAAFPTIAGRSGEIELRLVKSHDGEIICDQDGRPLWGVIGFRYEAIDPDTAPTLTIKVHVNACHWDRKMGEIRSAAAPTLEPKPL
jgi:hypothetical protein